MTLMAAVSNLSVSWIEGATGDQVLPQALPVEGMEDRKLQSSGARGSWRSHMNALNAVVDQELESALILEDDVDWDVRLRSQLQSFTIAADVWSSKSEKFNVTREITSLSKMVSNIQEGTRHSRWIAARSSRSLINQLTKHSQRPWALSKGPRRSLGRHLAWPLRCRIHRTR